MSDNQQKANRIKDLKLSDIKKMTTNARHIHLKVWQWVLIVIFFIVIIGGIIWMSIPKPIEPEYPVVAVQPVETDDVSIYGEYVGRINAHQNVEVRARVEGYLEKMLFDEGTYVKKGQTLFIIDPRLYKANVESAKARLNKAKAQAL